MHRALGSRRPSTSRRRLLALVLPTALVALVLVQSASAAGSASLTTLGTAYTQDFDTLASSGTANTTVPTGWEFAESGTNANAFYTAGTGSGNTGDTYSFGATGASDRAFGGLRSGTLVAVIGAQFTNATGDTITSLEVSYTGEQWRLGQTTTGRVPDRLDFQLSTNATNLTTGTWTDHDNLDFSGPVVAGTVGALNGNVAPNRTALTFTITGLTIPNGAAFWIRWADSNLDPGADDGLAVDDLSLTPLGAPPAAPIVSVSALDASAAEAGSDPGTFRFTRTGPTTDSLSATYTVGGTAAPGDYTPALTGSVTFPTGQASVDVTVTPVNDLELETAETVTVTLVDGADYDLGAGTAATVTIADDDVITKISSIQGSGSTSIPGTFIVEAIVVGDYQTQGSGQLRGFFVQEEDADTDADPATSEGIFVFCSTCPVAVAVGDKVRVTGASSEFFNMSQLTASTAASVSVLSPGNPLPTPAQATLPVPGVPSGDLVAATAAINAYFERSEGMLVTFPSTLTVAEYFELARYGQVILTEGGRPRTFTDANAPSATGFVDHEIDLTRRTVILDDADNRQNRPIDIVNTPYTHPVPGLSITNYFRGGDTITNLTGVLHWSFAGQTGTDAWRIRPVTQAFPYAFTASNPRPITPPAVGGRLKVASFNVLNYFLTVDTTSSSSTGPCGPSATLDCRGADSAAELERQRAKLTQALLGLDADVIGLMEMENTPGVTPQAQIVADLNAVAGVGTYAYVDTGVIGGDAIRVGLLYRTASVSPVGAFRLLTTSVDPDFDDTRNRPALAQAFEEVATGSRLAVAVNHLKSKGSGCGGAPDDDLTSGQGNCNGTRTRAAQALARWLADDPTGSGDPDVLIIGDLNSYAMEDPITALKTAGYTDLVRTFGGNGAYGYVFDGQVGYLDHALANATLGGQVTGVGEWHVNADEIPLFDYNDDIRDAGESAFEEESDALPLYAADPYRTSDHDPVVVGLSLLDHPTSLAITGTFYDADATPGTTLSATLSSSGTCSVAGRTVVFSVDKDGDGMFETVAGAGTTDASGSVQLTWTSASGWEPGIYDLRASFERIGNCLASTATATIAIVSPGDAANGGGWYQQQTTGSPRVNFGFTVKKQNDGSYRGQLLWSNNGKWRIKGTLTSFGKADPCSFAGTSGLRCGSAEGTGTLYRWNAATLTWDAVQAVAYVISFVDGGASKKGGAKPDFFGINVTNFTSPSLPESAPQQLKGGNVLVG